MTTRKEAIRLAEEAGVVTWFNRPSEKYWKELERLIQLAKNEAFREAARLVRPSWDKYECEAAILSLVKE